MRKIIEKIEEKHKVLFLQINTISITEAEELVIEAKKFASKHEVPQSMAIREGKFTLCRNGIVIIA